MKKRNRAFTLIEILIVIAIIGILMAVLLPSLGKTREHAKMMEDVNDLRQLAIADQMYADDHNGLFAPSVSELESYVEDPAVFVSSRDTREGVGPSDPSYRKWAGSPESLLPGGMTGALSENISFFMTKTEKTNLEDITLADADTITYPGYYLIARADGVAEAVQEEKINNYAMTLDHGPGWGEPAE